MELDLEISHYTLQDMEKFFQLKKGYSSQDVVEKEYEIRELLLHSGHVNPRFQPDLIHLLEKMKTVILETKFKNWTAPPKTTLAKNWKLDKINVPVARETASSRVDEIAIPNLKIYSYTAPSEFFRGDLNPLNTRILSKCLTIDTKFRENYYQTSASDFTTTLALKIYKAVSMQLTSIEFPLVFYGITATNNYLRLVDDENSNSHVFVVPEGNYTSQQLIATLNQLLVDSLDPFFSTLVFTLDSTSGKTTLYSSFMKLFTLDFSTNAQGTPDTVPIASKLGWNLGFQQATYSGVSTVQGELPAEPFLLQYLFLSIDDFQNNSTNPLVSAFSQSIFNPTILAKLAIQPNGSWKIVCGEPRMYFGPVDIQRLRIRIFDEFGRIYPVLGNYSFTCLFKTVYDL